MIDVLGSSEELRDLKLDINQIKYEVMMLDDVNITQDCNDFWDIQNETETIDYSIDIDEVVDDINSKKGNVVTKKKYTLNVDELINNKMDLEAAKDNINKVKDVIYKVINN